MNSGRENFVVCHDINEAVRLMKVAASILDGAEEYVASAFLMQALHHLSISECSMDPGDDGSGDYRQTPAGRGTDI